MATSKCSNCGSDIHEGGQTCLVCNSTVKTKALIGDINGDGKVDYKDALAAIDLVKHKTSECSEFLEKKIFPSTEQKIENDYDKLSNDYVKKEPADQTESQKKCIEFKAALESTIDLKLAKILASKPDTEQFLSYLDGQSISASVRNIFKTALKVSPPQIEAACHLSEVVLAPSVKEKKNLIKASISVSGGAIGIGMIIGGVGTALGWGASLIASVGTVFAGSSLAGPAGWAVAGISIAAIAGYFSATSNEQSDTERFLSVIRVASAKAVDAIWDEYENELTQSLEDASKKKN